MSDRKYPRDVWVLQPSFKPVRVTVTARYSSWSNEDYGDVTTKGKRYSPKDMFDSKDSAITEGYERCDLIRADIGKRQEQLRKKIAALDKAENP